MPLSSPPRTTTPLFHESPDRVHSDYCHRWNDVLLWVRRRIVSDSSAPLSSSTAPTQRPAALVFVPGITCCWGDQSLSALADDIVVSLDRQSDKFKFAVTPTESLSYGAGDQTRS